VLHFYAVLTDDRSPYICEDALRNVTKDLKHFLVSDISLPPVSAIPRKAVSEQRTGEAGMPYDVDVGACEEKK
jgi:hypothetical protein